MKKIVILMIMGLVTAGFLSAQVEKGGTLYVSAKTVTLKSSTGFFASNKGTLNYGDMVTVLQVSGKFVQVQSADKPSLTGWTASSNLSAKQIVSGNLSTISVKETALAGKSSEQMQLITPEDEEHPKNDE
jgi:uncharacterized protein YgiM (DUF1202 family)